MNERTPGQAVKSSAEAATYVNELVFWLNGKRVLIRDPDPAVLLTDYLHSIGLTGTKVGCGQGGCGAARSCCRTAIPSRALRSTARSTPACGRSARSMA